MRLKLYICEKKINFMRIGHKLENKKLHNC